MNGRSAYKELFAGGLCFLLVFWPGWFSAWCSTPGQLQDAYAKAAEKALPAVVTVYALQKTGGTFRTAGVGSGFFVTDDGYIITNYHVIERANALAVKLSTGKLLCAETSGVSQATDLAVLKIDTDGEHCPFLSFSDTKKVKVGHYAMAIGSPFALSQTVTVGIVSHKGRELGLHYKEDYIQTDASINPGNSGGPLLNIDGDVIGVNDCILAPGHEIGAGGCVGIGFAIDGNLAAKVASNIIRRAKKGIPFAGFVMENDEKANLPVVVKVTAGSPAEIAGMKKGDRIMQIGPIPVSSILEAQSAILSNYVPGDTAEFKILRDKGSLKITVQFERRK